MITTKSLKGDLNIFDILVENRGIAYLLLDHSMRIQFIHNKMADVLELDAKEVQGKVWYDVMPSMERYKALYESVLSGNDQDVVLFEMDFPEGKRCWEIDHLPTTSEKGEIDGLLVIAHEVTERHHMSVKLKEQLEALQRSNEKLSRSKKAYVNLLEDIHEEKNHLLQLREDLEVKSKRLRKSNTELAQFAYIASHDLQEPLRTISNFSSLLKSECTEELSEEASLYLEFVTEASDRMSDLISGLLDYSRIGRRSKKSLVNCKEVLIKVNDILGRRYAKLGYNCEFEGVIDFLGFPDDIETLFTQLLDNAIKFREPSRVCEIKITCEEQEDHLRFIIADNGIGFNSKFGEKIFQIYKCLHAREDFPGTGIGLSQCKKIVELHGGEIGVNTEQGKGSSFYFTIRKQD